MKGFFTKKEVQSTQNFSKPLSCISCGLYKKVQSPKMPPHGRFNKKIMIVCESPTLIDDRRSLPLQDRLNKKLTRTFKELGVNTKKDCIVTFVCKCATDTISDHQMACCRLKLVRDIEFYKPHIIFLVGKKSIESVIGNHWKKGLGDIEKWRGFTIPDRQYGAWLCPIYDENFIKDKKYNFKDLPRLIQKQDIRNALKKRRIHRIKEEKQNITLITSNKQFKAIIPEIKKADSFAFDYESTGLKPQGNWHKLLITGVAISETKCFVWENSKYRDSEFKKILKNPDIKKIAHNLQMENKWSETKLKINVKGWDWCTMNNAHVLDNRSGITSLKFQVYVNFGVADYDSEIGSYLVSDTSKGVNGINTLPEYIKKYGAEKPMIYCGLDALFTYKLKQIQEIKFNE